MKTVRVTLEIRVSWCSFRQTPSVHQVLGCNPEIMATMLARRVLTACRTQSRPAKALATVVVAGLLHPTFLSTSAVVRLQEGGATKQTGTHVAEPGDAELPEEATFELPEDYDGRLGWLAL